MLYEIGISNKKKNKKNVGNTSTRTEKKLPRLYNVQHPYEMAKKSLSSFIFFGVFSSPVRWFRLYGLGHDISPFRLNCVSKFKMRNKIAREFRIIWPFAKIIFDIVVFLMPLVLRAYQ